MAVMYPVVLAVLLLVGCGDGSLQAGPTPVDTVRPLPSTQILPTATSTIAFTATPESTATPEPTATPTASPTPAVDPSKLVEAVKSKVIRGMPSLRSNSQDTRMDEFCEAWGGMIAGQDATIGWDAHTEDPAGVVWIVTCSADYAALTAQGKKNVSEPVIIYLVDTEAWVAQYVETNPYVDELLGYYGLYSFALDRKFKR